MKQQTKRLLAGITIGGLGVLMLVVVLRLATVSVWATEQAAAKAAPISDWMPTLEDTFDGTYAATHTVPRNIGTSGAPYEWGRVIDAANPFSDTLWCMQGWSGTALVAGTDVYTDGVNTTLTYGPIDLTDAVTVSLSFRHWISVRAGDVLEWGVSTSGIPASYQLVTPAVPSSWETTTFTGDDTPALAALAGQPTVYVSFRFRSNNDGRVNKGVMLDDVKIWRRANLALLHLPVLWKKPPTPTVTPTPTATPTPTPSPGYRDDFDDVQSGWPREWERKGSNVNIRGGYLLDRTRAQMWDELMASREIARRRDPGESDLAPLDLSAAEAQFLAEEDEVYYAVLHDAWDRAFISGPYKAEGDFDLVVRARYSYVQKWFDGNRYGVLLTKEKVNPEDPHSIHGYSFQVEILPNSDGSGFETPWWRFKEWYRTNWVGDDAGDEDRSMGDDPTSAIHSSLGSWNTLRIERRGTSFHLYINGNYMRTVSDSDNTGPLYIGFIGRHTGSGATELSYDVLYEWDYVDVKLVD